MNCGMSIIKYLLFGINFLFIVFAFVLIGVGGGVELKFRDVVELTNDGTIVSAPILMLIVGIFIFFLALMGCVGAQKENYCLISTFSVGMVILLILQFAATITAYAMRDQIDGLLITFTNKAIELYERDNHEAPIGFVQEQFQCCGSKNGTSDWSMASTFQNQSQVIIETNNLTATRDVLLPDSCCVTKIVNCGLLTTSEVNENPCVDTVELAFKDNSLTVGGVGITVILIQVFGILFGCMMMRSFKPNYDVV